MCLHNLHLDNTVKPRDLQVLYLVYLLPPHNQLKLLLSQQFLPSKIWYHAVCRECCNYSADQSASLISSDDDGGSMFLSNVSAHLLGGTNHIPETSNLQLKALCCTASTTN